ncbi:MAG: MarR family winged helix-turn-helix transcriptional regulator [Solirubrobacteraceae bacterium]
MGERTAQRALEGLLRAEVSVRRRIAQQDEGLSNSAWSVLVLLREAGGESEQRALRERLGTSKANVSEVLSTLERGGLIVRRPLKRDRRACAAALTSVGQALVERLLPLHERRVELAFAALDLEEQRALAQLCGKLAA